MKFPITLYFLMACNVYCLRLIAPDGPGLPTFEQIDDEFAQALRDPTAAEFQNADLQDPAEADSLELRKPAQQKKKMLEFLSTIRQSAIVGATHTKWVTQMGEHCQSNQRAYYFPTVPRSGNTWSRLLLEQASGIVTSAVFSSEACNLETKCACGISKDCSHVRQPFMNETYVIKAHYPFYSTLANEHPPIEHALLTIRNPVDNYLAWRKYLMQYRHKSSQKIDKEWPVSVFLDKWVKHFEYWFAKARNSCMQITLVRFEDLTVATQDVLSTMTSALGYANANVGRALSNYPPDPQKVSQHLFRNRDLIATSNPVIRDLAQLALSNYEEILQELGYHEFVTHVANSPTSH